MRSWRRGRRHAGVRFRGNPSPRGDFGAEVEALTPFSRVSTESFEPRTIRMAASGAKIVRISNDLQRCGEGGYGSPPESNHRLRSNLSGRPDGSSRRYAIRRSRDHLSHASARTSGSHPGAQPTGLRSTYRGARMDLGRLRRPIVSAVRDPALTRSPLSRLGSNLRFSSGRSAYWTPVNLSGRPDSNRGPLRPERSALPD